MMKDPIIITGVERSGSTIVAKILQSCGVFTGEITSMGENAKLKNLLETYYDNIGVDRAGQYPLPNTSKLLIPADWKQTIIQLMRNDGWDGECPWLLKGFKLGQTWPLWQYAFPSAKWIVVRRRTGDIVYSCTKTAFMKSFNNEDVLKAIGVDDELAGWKWWIHQQEENFRQLIYAGANVKVVWPERMADGDFAQMKETLDWLRLRWHGGIVPETKQLLKNRKKEISWQE